MHMISKKDLSNAEMDTLTKSCSPTIVIAANGEVQTHEETIVYVKELDIFLTMKVLEKHASSIIAWKALRWKRKFLWMDQWSKTTSHSKRDSDTMRHGELRSCSGSRIVKFAFRIWLGQLQGHFQDRRVIIPHLLQARLRHLQYHSRTGGSNWKWHIFRDCVNYGWWAIGETRYWPSQQKTKTKPIKLSKSRTRNLRKNRRTCCWKNGETRCILKSGNDCKNSEKFLWMVKFLNREALTSVFLMKLLWSRLQRDVRIWVSTVFILISLKTEIARSARGPNISRAPCRTRNGGAVPRAENVGDLITADHKVLSELWISKQSSICSRGAGLDHSMDPVVSFQKQKLLRKH